MAWVADLLNSYSPLYKRNNNGKCAAPCVSINRILLLILSEGWTFQLIIKIDRFGLFGFCSRVDPILIRNKVMKVQDENKFV